MLDCIVVRTVFFEERGVLLGEQVSVREAVAEHIETGLHLFLGKILQNAFHHNQVHV